MEFFFANSLFNLQHLYLLYCKRDSEIKASRWVLNFLWIFPSILILFFSEAIKALINTVLVEKIGLQLGTLLIENLVVILLLCPVGNALLAPRYQQNPKDQFLMRVFLMTFFACVSLLSISFFIIKCLKSGLTKEQSLPALGMSLSFAALFLISSYIFPRIALKFKKPITTYKDHDWRWNLLFIFYAITIEVGCIALFIRLRKYDLDPVTYALIGIEALLIALFLYSRKRFLEEGKNS